MSGGKKAFVHVIASLDLDEGKGVIRYVLPSQKRTGSAASSSGPGKDAVTLVMRQADGKEIGRVSPELRFEACDDEDKYQRAIIQQDIEVPIGLSRIELVYRDKTLDVFEPEAGSAATDGLETMSVKTVAGPDHRSSVTAPGVSEQGGVTYVVQAKADNSNQWQTLAVGRSKPEFSIDKNQFPGATSLNVRVVRNAGFESRTIDERIVTLE